MSNSYYRASKAYAPSTPRTTVWVFLGFAIFSVGINGPAIAGEVKFLTDAQLDRVAAGALGLATGMGSASGNLAAQALTFTLSTVDPLNQTVLATGLSTASAASLLAPAVATSGSSAIALSRWH
jgi:hypothetical protein